MTQWAAEPDDSRIEATIGLFFGEPGPATDIETPFVSLFNECIIKGFRDTF